MTDKGSPWYIDTNLDGVGLGGPLLGLNCSNSAIVQVGHCCYHLRKGMVVLEGEMDEIMVHFQV